MRRLFPSFVLLAPVLMLACAFGKNALPRGGGNGGSGGGSGTDGAGAGVVDPPGSSESGGGSEEGDAGGQPGAGGGGQGGGGQGGSGQGPGGVGGAQSGCAHDPCSAGVALDSSCDPCVFETCSADSYCCETEWDDTCVGEATACGCQGGAGGGGQGGSGQGGFGGSGGFGGGFGGSGGGFGGSGPVGGDCAHDACVPGEALDASCDGCVGAVCDLDPFCCSDEWDIYCILEVAEACGSGCF